MHGATKRKTIPVKIQPTNPPQISIILLKNSCFVVTIFTPLVESTVYPARVSMDWLRELIIFFASFRCTVIPISIQLSTRRWEITASCISVDISMNTSSTQFCFIHILTRCLHWLQRKLLQSLCHIYLCPKSPHLQTLSTHNCYPS